ncbi:hypothetical protein M514_12667, partial [Trichuris suis]
GSHVVPANHYCVICRRLYSSFNLVICIASCAGREITCVFCNLLLKRCQIAMSKIFFEKQEGMMCAQHALNNLLQGAYFSAVDLAEIARKLDELERSVLGTVDGDLSLNVNDDGYFSVQVISEALKVFDLRLVGLCDFQARNVGSLMCSAFICNFENHWFTLRRIGGRWFNLNSLNSGPTIISDSHLELFLAQLTAEGYTVFVVEGELPPCPAENDVIDCSDIEEIVKVDSDPFQPKSLPALSPTDYADDSDEDFLKALIASREAADHNDRSLQKALMESKGLNYVNRTLFLYCSIFQFLVLLLLKERQFPSNAVCSRIYASPLSIVLPDCLRLNDSTCRAVMWFEARRQERKIRTIMVDHKKRAERRRFYYERIRKDPTEFMQLHGQACKIHFDCQSADSSSILRPWQGDPTVLIDRFDARSYLDKLPDSGKDSDRSKSSSLEERKINYERYRLLVINDFEKIPEEKFLRQIYMEERFGSSTQVQSKRDESKKKKHRPTAAIGYTYEDSTDSVNSYQQFVKTSGVSGKEGQQHWNAKAEENNLSSDEEEEDEFGTVFILLFIHQNSHFKDVRLDISQLTSEDMHELNRIATRYGMKMGDFTKFLAVDEQERDHLQSLKEMEEQRATLSGKHSRRERKRLKDICRSSRADFGLPLEMLRKVEPPSQQLEKPSESSTSESDDANENAVTYITSFDGDMKAEVKKKAKSKRHSSSARRRDTHSPIRRNCRRRSPSYSACDSRSSRKRLRRYSSASSSPSPDRRRQYSRGRDRRHRCHHHRHRDSSSSSSSSTSSTSSSSSSSYSRRSDRRGSCNSDTEVKSEKQTEDGQQSDSASDLSQLSIRSSMSDSEQERREVENTRRRLKRTKRELMYVPLTYAPNNGPYIGCHLSQCWKREVPASSVVKSQNRTNGKNRPSAAEILKLQTQRALKKVGKFSKGSSLSLFAANNTVILTAISGPRYRGKQDEARGAAARKNCTPRKFADVGSARFYCWSVCPLYDVILQEREEEFRELTFRRRQELDRRNRGMQDPELTQESFRSKVSRSNRSSYRRRENRSSSDTSRRHVRTMHLAAGFCEVTCDVGNCKKTFHNRKALYDHKVAVHRLLGAKRCQKCSKEFGSNSALLRHQRTHDGYRCTKSDCQMVFATYVSLRQHIAKSHRKRSVSCPQCGRTISRRVDLERHLQVHEKHVNCPVSGCSMKLHPSRLARHLKMKHAEKLVDQRKSRTLTEFCQQCGAGFANGKLLAGHKTRMHHHDDDDEQQQIPRSIEKPFACDVTGCNFQFRSFMRLQEHKNLHAGIKPFQCLEPQCNRTYALRASLQRHMKTFHLKTMAPYVELEKLMTSC